MAAPNWTQAQVLAQLDSGMHWRSSTITYAFPTTSSGIYADGEESGFRPLNSTQQSIARLALAVWDEATAASIVPGSVGRSDIEFGYTSTGIGYAHAYFPEVGSAWFNVTEPELVNPIVGEYGFMTFVHEIGHALGLDHMGDYNGAGSWSPSSYQDSEVLSVMSYFGPRGAAALYSSQVMQADWQAANGNTYSAQTPMLNDVMAIQAIYGASTTTRLDNTVYGFSSTVDGATGAIFDFRRNPYPVLTIFDSGGLDTLNLSGWSTPSRIDLHAGAFTSANDMTNNIAIAYNTTVENAVGGGGNDVIVGNDAANVLEGGAGGDELQGLGGNDTLTGGTGNDIIDGGTGDDTAVFDGVFALFTVSSAGNVVTLTSTGTGTDRVSGVERFRFTDGTRTLTDLSPTADITAPLLSGLSPADNSANLSVGTSFVLTFNESVKAGSGSLHIWLADGSLWRSVAVGNTTQLRFSGNSVTLDPSANLPANGSYYITVDAGAISDAAGNDYAGFSGAGQWNFSTSAADTHAPQVIALTPADEGTGASTRADLVIEFDEPVSAGSGNIVIQKGVTPFATIAVTDTSRVRISGNTVTINPSADFEQGAAYNVTLDRGTFKDASGNAFAGATASNWNFATASAPQGDDYPLGPDTQGQLASTGSVLNARIDGPSDGDMFRVTLTAGVTYRFDMMSSSGIDPYLVLYGQAPGYELVAFDDDGGPLGHDAQLYYTATEGGVYYLAAYDNTDTYGAYGIAAGLPSDDYLASTATSGKVRTDGVISFGNITAPTDSDMFAATLTGGTQVTFDLRSAGLANPFLRLFDAQGKLLAADDSTGAGKDAQITFDVPATGTYFAAAADYDTGMGAYRLTAVLRNVVPGGSGDDALTGTHGADTLQGGDGNDRLQGGLGDDIIQADAGIDIAAYAGAANRFVLQHRSTDWVITDGTGGTGTEGRDLLHGVERVHFADRQLAIDLDGHAGEVARILGAVFGPASVANPAYVGIGLGLADGGMDEAALMQLALDARLGAGYSHAALVDLLYTNLAGVAPTPDVQALYTAALADGTYTPLSLATLAAEHEINLANIGYATLQEQGLVYV